jgi:hypothetical protein
MDSRARVFAPHLPTARAQPPARRLWIGLPRRTLPLDVFRGLQELLPASLLPGNSGGSD